MPNTLRSILAASLIVIALAATTSVRAHASDLWTGTRVGRLPLSTLGWLWSDAPHHLLAMARHALDRNASERTLEQRHGWQHLGFEPRQQAQAVAIRVEGEMQFRRAEIFLENGDQVRFDLQYVRFANGSFELKNFGEPHAVVAVNVLARSVSDRSTLTIDLAPPQLASK